MNINPSDLPLVKAFLEREALDYGNKVTQVFANHLLRKIEEGLSTYAGTANYLTICSYGNVGALNRSLTITPSPWGFSGNVTIDLCTCGNPYCWGTIKFPDGTSWGKKGMTPLTDPIEDDE